jgi:hypothetical protein
MATPRPPRPDLSDQRARSFPGRDGADRGAAADAASRRAALAAALRERRSMTAGRSASAMTAADLRAVLARKLDDRKGATR